MREIKFRAWVVDEYEADGNTPKTFKMYQWEPQFFSDMSPVTAYGSDFPELDDPTCILMQFTGLLDKNGKEIYEGDVIKGKNYKGYDMVSPVIWWGSGWYAGYDAGKTMCVDSLSSITDAEVIGNIYENPAQGGQIS